MHVVPREAQVQRGPATRLARRNEDGDPLLEEAHHLTVLFDERQRLPLHGLIEWYVARLSQQRARAHVCVGRLDERR
ncbi:MAG: hypothetical protein IPG17_02345 [Sandaracinaceae bacterium]|nr:hypothetical protein [Sandaracinaceae bacterium]